MKLWRWALAFAVGYVLGAKAGRERYEQIVDAFNSFRGTEQGQRVEEAATRAGQRVEEAAAGGVAKVTDIVREKKDVVREKTGQSDATSTGQSDATSYGSGGTSTYGGGGTSTSGY